jgi:hypothetical protein
MSRSTTIRLPILEVSTSTKPAKKGRGRSSSLVKVEEVGDRSVEEVLDRSAFVNMNADWVNYKGSFLGAFIHVAKVELVLAGAWLIHIVLICVGKIIIDTIPGMTQEISWTLVNLIYLAVCVLQDSHNQDDRSRHLVSRCHISCSIG